MKRRAIVSMAGGTALGTALPVLGQTSPKVYRIGVVIPFPSKDYKPNPIFLQAMRELGYEEGRNVVYERRFTEGHDDRLSDLFAGLVEKRVDVLLAYTSAHAAVAKRATSTIPIVMLYGDGPVEMGLVASLSRPGGNITGVTTVGPEPAAKGLQILRDIVPKAKHLGILIDPDYAVAPQYVQAFRKAAAVARVRA